MVYTKSIEQADMMRLLDSLYDTAVNGVDKKHVIGEKMPVDALLKPVEKIVNTYLTKHRTPEKAAASVFLSWRASGFPSFLIFCLLYYSFGRKVNSFIRKTTH